MMQIEVTGEKGEVTNYFLIEHEVVLVDKIPKISRTAAVERVTPNIKLLAAGGRAWRQADLLITGDGNAQKLCWRIAAIGFQKTASGGRTPEATVRKGQTVLIDAQNGRLLSSTVTQSKQNDVPIVIPKAPARNTSSVFDAWPMESVGNAGIYFITSRGVSVGNLDGLMNSLALSTSEVRLVLSTPLALRRAAVSGAGRIAFEAQGNLIYVLDMRSGQLGRCNDGDRAAYSMPSWGSVREKVSIVWDAPREG